MHLNTSHVKVNRYQKMDGKDMMIDLNTSHVKVNPQ